MVDFGAKRFRSGFAAVIIAALLVAVVIDVTQSRGEGDDARDGSAAGGSPSATPEPPETDDPGPTQGPGSSATSSAAPDEPGLPPELEQAMSGVPERARGATELAEQIVVAERAIADPETPGKVLAAAGHLQQVAYRVLGPRPRWDDKVLAAVPEELRPVVRDNVTARRQFRSMHDTLVDTLPAWRIVRPARAVKLRQFYRQAEREYGVDWEYLAAINLVETGMGRIRGTSVAGAQGPMQFMPGTWASYGEGDVHDPHDAIMAAARYLSAMGYSRDPEGALYRYNNHTAYVRGVSLLAKRMQARPRAYIGYYHWQIYFLSSEGDVLLPLGYSRERPIKVEEWLDRTGREAARP